MSNSIDSLIKMANQIGSFFQAEPDRDTAIQGIEQHIRSFWEPRMRKQIIEYVQHDGRELNELVAAAVRKLG
jgi:formate dehydrogenase subunit delta